jgi:hypothetical protein
MSDIIYYTYKGFSANPDMIFGDLKFKLKRFDFDKDIIFKNMTKLKKKNKEDMTFDEAFEDVMFLQTYEFNYDNVLEKLKEFYPGGIVEISDTMFIQLYLHLLTNKNKRFIFKRKAFESMNNASDQVSTQRYIDNNQNLLFVLYYDNYHTNKLLQDVKCPYTHLNLLKTGIDKNYVDVDSEVYSGITEEGIIYTKNIMDWAKYIRQKCKEWIEENKKVSTLEYESFNKIEDNKEDNTSIICYNREEKDKAIIESKKHSHLYSKKKNLEISYNYFGIGYFDILEFSNCIISLAINPVKEMIVDIK